MSCAIKGSITRRIASTSTPKPQQKPHPPVYIASNSSDTFELVGSMGHNILVAPIVVTVQGALDGLKGVPENTGGQRP